MLPRVEHGDDVRMGAEATHGLGRPGDSGAGDLNRLADGLGVDIPAERQEAMSGWVTGPAREHKNGCG